MENRIKEYIEEIFAPFPESGQKEKVKRRVFAEAMDSYHDFLVSGKKPQSAYQKTIDGIDMQKIQLEINPRDEFAQSEKKAEIPVFDKSRVISAKKKTALLQALAVFLYINSLTAALILVNTPLITTVAPIMLFLCIAVGTVLLVYNRNSRLPKYNIIDFTEEETADNRRKCRLLRVAGIIVVAVGLVCNMLTDSFLENIAFIMYGLGVALIIYGSAYSYGDVSEEDIINAYQNRQKYQAPAKCRLRNLRCGLWLVTVAVYLVLSVATGFWYATWLLFLLAAAISNLLRGILDKRGKTSVVLWSVCSVLAALILAGALLGASVDFGGIKLNAGTVAYDNAEMYETGAAELKENINSMEINWMDGTAKIEVYDGNTVKIEEDGNLADDAKLRYYAEGGKLVVQYCKSNLGISDNVPHNKNLVIKIPAAMAENLTDISVASTSSDLTLNGFTAETLTVDKISGNVECNNLNINSLNISSVSADCTFVGSCEFFTNETTSGDVNFTASGNTFPQKIVISNVSGDTEINLPADMPGFLASVSTVSSTFNTDFFVTEEKGGYCYGNGSALYSVNTVSGKVSINQIK